MCRTIGSLHPQSMTLAIQLMNSCGCEK